MATVSTGCHKQAILREPLVGELHISASLIDDIHAPTIALSHYFVQLDLVHHEHTFGARKTDLSPIDRVEIDLSHCLQENLLLNFLRIRVGSIKDRLSCHVVRFG